MIPVVQGPPLKTNWYWIIWEPAMGNPGKFYFFSSFRNPPLVCYKILIIRIMKEPGSSIRKSSETPSLKILRLAQHWYLPTYFTSILHWNFQPGKVNPHAKLFLLWGENSSEKFCASDSICAGGSGHISESKLLSQPCNMETHTSTALTP